MIDQQQASTGTITTATQIAIHGNWKCGTPLDEGWALVMLMMMAPTVTASSMRTMPMTR